MTSFQNAQNFNYLIAFFRGLFHQARKSEKMSYLPLRLLSIGLSNNDGINGFAFQLYSILSLPQIKQGKVILKQ